MTATKTKNPTVKVTVATFDSTHPIFRVRAQGNLRKFEPFTDYQPHMSTPLRDATMQMIQYMEKLQNDKSVQIGLLLDESGSMSGNRDAVIAGVNEFISGMREVPAREGGRVLCVIFTDGLENASTDVTPEALRAKVTELEERGWTFIYMGANQDAWSEGSRNVGISGRASGQSVNYSSTPVGTQSAFKEASRRSSSYLSGQASYDAMAASIGNNSVVNEDGTLDPGVATPTPKATPKATPKPPKPPTPSYGSVSDAIEKAKGGTS